MADKSKTSATPAPDDEPVDAYAAHTTAEFSAVTDDAPPAPATNGDHPTNGVSLDSLARLQDALAVVQELQPRYVPEPQPEVAPRPVPVFTATTEFSALNTLPSAHMPHTPDPFTPAETARARLTPEDYTLKPAGTWPPPIYVRPEADDEERFYLEWRWHAQWAWYDKRAADAKRWHQTFQVIIGVGSVSVPVLVGFNPPEEWRFPLTILTVGISLAVAIAAALENVYKHGDNWRNFRAAAEELTREKSMYDMGAGPYRRAKNKLAVFIERCEDIIAKQNGNWLQLQRSENAEQEGERAGRKAPTPAPFSALTDTVEITGEYSAVGNSSSVPINSDGSVG